jgi:hypothetical protein
VSIAVLLQYLSRTEISEEGTDEQMAKGKQNFNKVKNKHNHEARKEK